MTPGDDARFRRALARRPGRNFAQGLTRAGLGAPDLARMLAQHAAYVDALRALGLEVQVLEPLEEHPDAHFVEDTAVLARGVTVIARPGAPERRGEERSIEAALADRRPVQRIEAPGTLDGGDVLEVDGHFFIGLSQRTNEAGAEQLARILAAHGRTSVRVPVGAGLHLKSDVNGLGGGRLLVSESLAAHAAFDGYERIVVPAEEAYACNALALNGTILMARGFPRTRARLAELDLPVLELDMSEAQKMDGGLTCLSLRCQEPL